MDKRLAALDGLRAIAIFWVVVYHYCVFWAPAGRGTELLPYGDALAWVPLASAGEMGVLLFFIVSGLVISLSLERSPGPVKFALLRGIRLLPMLFICGALTFAATTLLGPADLQRSLAEYVISMTLIPPTHAGKLFGHPEWQWLDGAYWSLWVEVRFYALAALLYFAIRLPLLHSWTLFSTIMVVIHVAGVGGHPQSEALSRLLFAEFHPFFSAGIALACLIRRQHRRLAWTVVAVSAGLAYLYAKDTTDPALLTERLVGLAVVLVLALAACLAPHRVKFLSWAPLTAMGRASYGYYLLHQNIGLAILLALPVTGVATIWAMLGVQAGLLVLALLLYAWIDVPLGARLRLWLKRPRGITPKTTSQPAHG